jgi:hypothetical protein
MSSYWLSAAPQPSGEPLEEAWELMMASPEAPVVEPSTELAIEPEHESPEFQMAPAVIPLGLYSLITSRILGSFFQKYQQRISCYWPADSDSLSRGALRIFRSSGAPPGWVSLSELFSRGPVLREQFNAIVAAELIRLRQLELQNPYSTSPEFTSPLLRGLLLYRPFFVYLWTEISLNPYTDLVVTVPLERLYDESQPAHPWRETIDSIVNFLNDRPISFPPLVVHLIGPRLCIVDSEAARQQCRAHGMSCGDEYSKWVNVQYF